MRLTMMTDYAMRLLMYVAQHPDRLCTIAEVARVYDVSEAHLMKVTHQLGLNGWIETVRGKGGGMRLAHPPDKINLGAVVRSMESDFQLTECFGTGNKCSLTGSCRLTGIVQEALQGFLKAFDSHTLADIVPPGSGSEAGTLRARPLTRMGKARAA